MSRRRSILTTALVCAASAAPASAQPVAGPPSVRISVPHALGVVVPVGDVNADGRDDLFVQQVPEDRCASTAQVVLGGRAGEDVDVSALGARGITITDVPSCLQPWMVAALGDVNGDGRADIGIGGDARTPSLPPRVLFGRAGGGTVSYAAPGSAGFTFDTGGDRTVVLRSIAAVGDVNGDRRADIGLGGAYGPANARRAAVGVVFGRAAGGDVDLRDARTPGLLVGDPSSPIGTEFGRVVGVGDVNRDGRADLAITPGGPRVVYGRQAPGFVDVRLPGTGAALGRDPFNVFGQVDLSTVDDLNGDGARELVSAGQRNLALPSVKTVLSSTTAPHYDLAGAARASLSVSASLGYVLDQTLVDDVTGDGRRDLLATALYPMREGRWVKADAGFYASYLLADLRPRPVDLRTATSGVQRFAAKDAVPPTFGTARFTGGRRLLIGRSYSGLVLRDLVQRPDPPADRTAPVISRMSFLKQQISNACPSLDDLCSETAKASLTFELSEAAYVELELRRGSTVISVTRGPVYGWDEAAEFAVPATFELAAVASFGAGVERLPAGAYTMVMKPTDLAGNVGTAQTASIVVTR